MRNQKGFTLIELMATLAILALIIAIAIPAVGNILDRSAETADDSSIELMERAGELADVAKLPHDGGEGDPLGDVINAETGEAETEAYRIPTLIKEGYLNMELDNKFNQPENYVVKVNKSGTYVYKGEGQRAGSGGDEPGDVVTNPGEVDTALNCEEAESQGYTCIYTPEEFDAMRSNMSGKYILMNDIDLAQFDSWVPIGTYDTPFEGVLNGNGKSLLNFTFTGNVPDGVDIDAVGVFGVVTHGEFMNLMIENVSITVAEDSDWYWDIGILAGEINSDADNNPTDKPFTVSNVSLAGVIDVEASSYVGGLFAVASSTSDVIIEHVKTDVVIHGDSSVAGLFVEVEFDENHGDFFVRNIEINGEIASYHASGLGMYVYSYDYDGDGIARSSVFEDIVVNASVFGIGDVSGFLEYFDGNSADDTLLIRNIYINGDVIGSMSVAGFMNYLGVFGYTSSLVENIKVSADISIGDVSKTYAEASGLFGRLVFNSESFDVTGDHIVRNMEIDSRIESHRVYGIGSRFEFGSYVNGADYSNVSLSNIDANVELITTNESVGGFGSIVVSDIGDVSFDTITINASMRSAESFDPEWLPSYSGFAGSIINSKPVGNLSIQNIDLTSNVVTAGNVNGFARSVEQSVNETDLLQVGGLLIEDVVLNGTSKSTLGNVFGFVDRIESLTEDAYDDTANMRSGPMTFRDISINHSLAADNGSVYVFNNMDDLRSYYLGYREVELPDGYMGREYHTRPRVSTDLVFENVAAEWDLSGNAGLVRNKRNDIYTDVSSGHMHSVALELDGSLRAWGYNSSDQVSDTPKDKGFVAIDAGNHTSAAIKSDGSLIVWGTDTLVLITDAPKGNDFIDVSVGTGFIVAMKADGSLVAWGEEHAGAIADVPKDKGFVKVSASNRVAVALKEDGSLVSWGDDYNGMVSGTPKGNGFIAVDATHSHVVAVRSDGSLVAWGSNYAGELDIPNGNDFVDVSTGERNSFALKLDGSIVSWGYDGHGQLDNTPTGKGFRLVDSAAWHTVAIQSDGSVEAWGYDGYNVKKVPFLIATE